MYKYDIIDEINTRVRSNYKAWTIGVTDDPEARKLQHENDGYNIEYWAEWKTDSEKDGREIEKHFVENGMKGGGGGGGKAGYVYIF